jgi:hypothetical protein
MPIKVYHTKQAESSLLIGLWPNGKPQVVDDSQWQLIAHLHTDHLEEAFCQSQNSDGTWALDAQHVLHLHPGPYPCGTTPSHLPRSTSVGDILERCATGERFLVAAMGFVPLPPRPAPPLAYPCHPAEWRTLLAQTWDVALAWCLVGRRLAEHPVGGVTLHPVARRDALCSALTSWLAVDPTQAMSDETDLRVPLLLLPVTPPSWPGNPKTPTDLPQRTPARPHRVDTVDTVDTIDTDALEATDVLEATVEATDTPIPAASRPLLDELPVDGYHRLFKGIREGQFQFPAIRLSPLEAAIIDTSAVQMGRRRTRRRFHTCGCRLCVYSQPARPWQRGQLAHGAQTFIWCANDHEPLLTMCPGCGEALEPTELLARSPQLARRSQRSPRSN